MQDPHSMQESNVIAQVGNEQEQIEKNDEERERECDRHDGTEERWGGEPRDHRHEHEARSEIVEEKFPHDDVLPIRKMNGIVLLVCRRLTFNPCSIPDHLPSYSRQTTIVMAAIASIPIALA